MGFLDVPREEGVLSLYPVCDISGEISSCTGIETGREKREGKREREQRNSNRERGGRKLAYTLPMDFEGI